MPVIPSTDPARQRIYDPDEAPTQRTRHNPNEAPARRRTVPPPGYSPPQQAATPPPRQGGNAAPQQNRSIPPQRASYPPSQQAGYPQGEERSSSPPQYIVYPPQQRAGYQPGQAAYPPAQPGYPAAPGANGTLTGQQANGATRAGSGRSSPYAQRFYPPPGQPASGMQDISALAGFNARGFWHTMSLLGQVAGSSGVLLLISFFLPWFFTPDFSNGTVNMKSSTPTISHSEWQTASGLPIFDRGSSFDLFPHLWLLLLCSLALIAIAALLGMQRIEPRLASGVISVISLFAMLLEFLFLLQATSIQTAVEVASGGKLKETLYGVSWGFWLTVIATIVTLGVSLFTVLRAYVPDTRHTSRAPGPPGGNPGQRPYPKA